MRSGIATVTLTTTRQAVVTANVAGKTATVTVALESAHRRRRSRRRHDIDRRRYARAASPFVSRHGREHPRRPRQLGRRHSAVAGCDLSASRRSRTSITEAGTVHRHGHRDRCLPASPNRCRTTVTVLPAQPPSVWSRRHPTSAAVNQQVVLRAQSPATRRASSATSGTFGSDATVPSHTTTGNQVQNSWSTPGTKIISVTVFQAAGPSGDGFGYRQHRLAVDAVTPAPARNRRQPRTTLPPGASRCHALMTPARALQSIHGSWQGQNAS